MKLGLACALLTLILAAPARAGDEAARCDALAADPHDPQRAAPGVLFFEIDAGPAVAACAGAMTADPENVRLQFQYARALAAANREGLARETMQKAAERGYPAAEAEYGFLLLDLEDLTESLRWTQKAADHGLPLALGDLGWRYMSGVGVKRDFPKALGLIRKAVEAGDEFAMCHLGEIYENGWGVKADDAEAVKWYRAAAERRYRGGWYHLALMLERGRGVARDEAEAEKLLEKAAAQRLVEAGIELARLRERRGG